MICLMLVICVILLSGFIVTPSVLSDKNYEKLPPIYVTTDYKKCDINNNMYCKVDMKLKPSREDDKLWLLIEATRRDKFLYNHDEIYRTICVPKMYENSSKDMENYVKSYVDEEVKTLNLKSTVEKITCDRQYSFTTTDYLLIILELGYLCLVSIATYYDVGGRRKGTSNNDILYAFSLRRNYKKIWYENKDIHYKNLKCMQGFRTITCVLVICLHTQLSFSFTFVSNTKHVEESYQKFLFFMYLMSGLFLTQIFSLISAWLLTVQVLDIFEVNNEFTIKDVFIIFINRIFRLWPALIIAIINARKTILNLFIKGDLMYAADTTAASCEKFGFRSLLFIQNNFYGDEVCNEGYWFISTDIQLYLVCLIVLYFMLKLKLTKRILQISVVLSYGLFGIIIYLNNCDAVPHFNPEFSKYSKFLRDNNMLYVYKMSHAHLTTYIMGICFGAFYYKHHRSGHNEIKYIVWVSSFLVFPLLAVLISTREYSGLSAALVGPLLKPMFAFGIGIGILGMSQSTNKNGILKKIFEWRPLEFLSQFTYCAYLYHFLNIIWRISEKPFKFTHQYILALIFTYDVTSGFLLGFLGHLLIELPWRQVQKKFLPHVKKIPIKDK